MIFFSFFSYNIVRLGNALQTRPQYTCNAELQYRCSAVFDNLIFSVGNGIPASRRICQQSCEKVSNGP